MNIKICQWVLKAGITKHITFHLVSHNQHFSRYKINQLQQIHFQLVTI